MASPTTIGPSMRISPATAPEYGITSSGMATRCSGCEPSGPASRKPLRAENGAGQEPE